MFLNWDSKWTKVTMETKIIKVTIKAWARSRTIACMLKILRTMLLVFKKHWTVLQTKHSSNSQTSFQFTRIKIMSWITQFIIAQEAQPNLNTQLTSWITVGKCYTSCNNLLHHQIKMHCILIFITMKEIYMIHKWFKTIRSQVIKDTWHSNEHNQIKLIKLVCKCQEN